MSEKLNNLFQRIHPRNGSKPVEKYIKTIAVAVALLLAFPSHIDHTSSPPELEGSGVPPNMPVTVKYKLLNLLFDSVVRWVAGQMPAPLPRELPTPADRYTPESPIVIEPLERIE